MGTPFQLDGCLGQHWWMLARPALLYLVLGTILVPVDVAASTSGAVETRGRALWYPAPPTFDDSMRARRANRAVAPLVAEQRARARARARSRRRKEAVSFEQQDPSAAAHVTGLGTAYVSTPTLAPPVMQLNPWSDAQPVDTAIGAFLATGLSDSPTVTPLPMQGSLDIVRAGCPVLLTWPREMHILALDPCGTTSEGSWRDASTEKPIVIYGLSCSPFDGGMAPRVSYSQVEEGERGELIAASQMRTTLVGSKIDLMDCAGNLRYMVEEKVFHQKNSVDTESCEKYGSCDGTVWIQYFLRQPNGTAVAQTGYLNIFQANFDIIEPSSGAVMASAERVGDWNPMWKECLGPRKWRLTFAEQPPPGPLALPTEQWPLASLVTILSVRDASRRSSGLLMPTFCEVWKVTGQVIWILVLVIAGTFGILLFLRDVVPPLTASLYDLELRICPRRMIVPSKYDGA
mmetsp:Transcript_125944/g.317615  ORF Transcript_125944/g.317615 Transcript_125944/m.317615 type:complete len:460 (+) Transcript_125944:196-1575(+)